MTLTWLVEVLLIPHCSLGLGQYTNTNILSSILDKQQYFLHMFS